MALWGSGNSTILLLVGSRRSFVGCGLSLEACLKASGQRYLFLPPEPELLLSGQGLRALALLGLEIFPESLRISDILTPAHLRFFGLKGSDAREFGYPKRASDSRLGEQNNGLSLRGVLQQRSGSDGSSRQGQCNIFPCRVGESYVGSAGIFAGSTNP